MAQDVNLSSTEISVEDIAVLREAYSRKMRSDELLKDSKARNGMRGLLDRRKAFMSQTSAEELGELCQDALRERYSVLNSSYQRTPGKLDDQSSLFVLMPKDAARKDVRLSLSHSRFFFGNRYRMNDGELSLTTQRDYLKSDPGLGMGQRRVLEKEIGRMAEESRNREDIERLSDSELSKRVNDVRMRLAAITDRFLDKATGMAREFDDKSIDLKTVSQEMEWRSKTLSANYFPSRDDAERCRLIDDFVAKSDNILHFDPSCELAKDMNSERRDHLQDARLSIDQLWNDALFRNMELGKNRDSDICSICRDFSESAAMSGHDWKQVELKIDRHLSGYSREEKESAKNAALSAYCGYNQGSFRSYSQYVNAYGSGKGYNYSAEARNYCRDSADMRRMYQNRKELFAEDGKSVSEVRRHAGAMFYDTSKDTRFKPVLLEKVRTKDSSAVLTEDAAQEYRDGYFREMSKQTVQKFKDKEQEQGFKDYLAAGAGLLAASAVPGGMAVAAILWALKDDELQLAEFCEKYDIRIDKDSSLRDSAMELGLSIAQADEMEMQTEYFGEIQRVDNEFKQYDFEAQPQTVKPAQVEGEKPVRTESHSSQYTIVTEDNAMTVGAHGKLASVSEDVSASAADDNVNLGGKGQVAYGDGVFIDKQAEGAWMQHTQAAADAEEIVSAKSESDKQRASMKAAMRGPEAGFAKGVTPVSDLTMKATNLDNKEAFDASQKAGKKVTKSKGMGIR